MPGDVPNRLAEFVRCKEYAIALGNSRGAFRRFPCRRVQELPQRPQPLAAIARPLGKGLSSPTVNVIWALANLIIGYVLFRIGKISSGGNLALIVFFAGIVAISTWLSVLFSKLRPADRPSGFAQV